MWSIIKINKWLTYNALFVLHVARVTHTHAHNNNNNNHNSNDHATML